MPIIMPKPKPISKQPTLRAEKEIKERKQKVTDMENMLINDMKKRSNIDEKLKETDQMKWVGLMNNYRHCAEEVVFDSIIYT